MNPPTDDRIQAASEFLLQSPPGEINDVLNDIRNIIQDDDSLQEGVRPALQQYNLTQFTTFDVPGENYQSIISEAAKTAGDEERFVDPRSKKTFVFDHILLEASEPLDAEVDSASEPVRAALEAATSTYLSSHYHSGVSAVFSTPGNSDRFVIQIVANKYNPSNYWSGRWRSEYIVDLGANALDGSILVDVHYYEQGNVQLKTTHDVHFTLPPAIKTTTEKPAMAKKVLALIETEERKYQESLNETYHDMGDKTFKGLRRALPLTRQKLDWDKVLGYKLGAELSASKGAFGS